MKKLIKKILKESVDNRIIDILIKLNLTGYHKVEEFLKETGYDDNEVKEIYSTYFNTISGLDLTPVNWMNFYFNPKKLKVVKSQVNPLVTFYKKDGKVVMEHYNNGEHSSLSLDYNDIWSFFESFYGVETIYHLKEVLKNWFEKTLKLKVNKIRVISN